MARTIQEQLGTARMLLAQFAAQVDEYDAMNREQRRTARGRDLEARMPGLRDGLKTWMARAADLEAQLPKEDTE